MVLFVQICSALCWGACRLDRPRASRQRQGVRPTPRQRRDVGRVGLVDGKVWRDVAAGPDQYLGRVHEDGRMEYHVAGRSDEYIGRITGEATLAHVGAAFLLLAWPAFVEHQ